MSRNSVLLAVCLVFGLFTYCEAVPEDALYENSSEKGDNDTEKTGAYAVAHANVVSQQQQHFPFLVECYVCTDCPHVNETTPRKLCHRSLNPHSNNKCVVYAEKYRHMDRSWYIRGCASDRGNCADIRQAHEKHPNIVKLQFCAECEGELCNNKNNASTLTECTIAFIMLIVTPALSKFSLA